MTGQIELLGGLKMEKHTLFEFLCAFTIFASVLGLSVAGDTLSSGQSIKDGEVLVSPGQNFELGFFSPGNSKYRFLGIWYRKMPQTVVWVANRNNSIADSNGTLTISNEGALVLLNGLGNVTWSSNLSGVLMNPIAQLLDSGNFVLKENTSSDPFGYVWQSFDYPSDTQLPGMMIGWNLATGLERHLTSWRSTVDPSPGDYTYGFNLQGLPQGEIVRKDGEITFRSGPWNGIRFSGMSIGTTSVAKPTFVYNATDVYLRYEAFSEGVGLTTRVTLNQAGLLQRLVNMNNSTTWGIMYSNPMDPCDTYANCGANGLCRIDHQGPMCICLQGYVPKSPEEWGVYNWSSGCVRKIPLNCTGGDGLWKLSGVKLPDLIDFWLNKSMSLEECKAECLKNCSCAACANSDITRGGSGCLMWFGDLTDIRDFQEVRYDQSLYIRLSASELDSIQNRPREKKPMIIAISSASGLFILGMAICIIYWKRQTKMGGWRSAKDGIDIPLFDFATIAAATENFSERNFIGAGGFGPVYKGSLFMDKQIAVKKLSKGSAQGLEEFMNEVVLIAKLQHRNLVGLVGCCIERQDRMLIYEYMPNGSLDQFIFDQDRSLMLGWERRFGIVMGIARGLLYLHQDSKLQVIHRDLKASNILLDANLNPKISDFGLARIFGGDENEARTRRVVGTYGYMSPEYALDGKFSVKSDVFSFGVLLLEIVSGKRNRGFHDPNHHHNLLGHAWLLWIEGRALELLDECLRGSFIKSQVERCINVGLLCVQKFPEHRPTISSVASMLGSEGTVLPQPEQPGFFMERSLADLSVSPRREDYCAENTKNMVSITMLEPR